MIFHAYGFESKLIENTKGSVIIRNTVKNEKEMSEWLDAYSLALKCRFAMKKSYQSLKYVQFHKLWRCRRGNPYCNGKKMIFTGCPVTVRMKIRTCTQVSVRTEMRLQKDAKHRDANTYPCLIEVKGEHNHPIELADALHQLYITPETKAQFDEYFSMGLTTAQASRLHEDNLNLNHCDLANTAINPNKRKVAYLREKWLALHNGSLGDKDTFSAVKEYAKRNPTSIIEFQVDKYQFAIVLVTPFMMRIHKEFREASETVLVNTTKHDKQNTAVTLLLCAGPSGAAPLAVIFTSSQDESIYELGFCLLKQVLGENGFFSKGHPECFMIDDCEAKRKALRKVWPQSPQVWSIFHVLQGVWKWLCKSCNRVKEKDRQQLMKTGKQLLYAESKVQFESHWKEFIQSSLAHQYDTYVRYLTNLMESQEEWDFFSEVGKQMCGHQINSYAESTIGIIKGILVTRCKSFSACQLLMFMNTYFDNYMRRRLIEVAYGLKQVNPLENYYKMMSEITQKGNLLFTVKSGCEDIMYDVDMEIGICSCTSGQTGAVCRHQIACTERYLLHLPQGFQSTPENCHWLASVAVGEEELPFDLFTDIRKYIRMPLDSVGNSGSASSHTSEMVTMTGNKTLNDVAGDSVCASVSNRSEEAQLVYIIITPHTNLSSHSGNDYLTEKEPQHQLHSHRDVYSLTESGTSNAVVNFINEVTQVISQYADEKTIKVMNNISKRLNSIKSGNELNRFLCSAGLSSCYSINILSKQE